MNADHMRICTSEDWAKHIENTLLPWVIGDRDIGDNLLEVGPGPGLTTDRLHQRVKQLTAVEYDPELAEALRSRFEGSNVEVINADATDLPFDNNLFSGAACFTMLHHVPSEELQDRLLAEVYRVLQPGAALVGVDSLDSPGFRKIHIDDTCVPINPLTFEERLRRAGFRDVDLTVWSVGTRFMARK